MPMRICSACRPRACASSRSTGRGGGPTWRCGCSPRRSWRASRSSCSITATCGATSPMSTTWWNRSCGWSSARRPAIRTGRAIAPDPGSSAAPWRVYNIGNNNPVELLEVVRLLEQAIGKKAKRELLPMQPGDVPATYADVDDLMREVDFKPATPIADGIARFIEWYRAYHRL